MPESPDAQLVKMQPGMLYHLPPVVECNGIMARELLTRPHLMLRTEDGAECEIPVTEGCLMQMGIAIARRLLLQR